MFDDVTRREGATRAVRRGAWLAGSTALQAALIVALIVVPAAVAHREPATPLVEVKLVRPAVPSSPAPPPPPAPRHPAAHSPAQEKLTPQPAMVQPREVPATLRPPEPPSPPPEDQGSEQGAVGGAVGGVLGGVTGGAPSAAGSGASGPVKFDAGMTAPVLVSAPPLEYTERALEHEVEGTMVVECTVRVDGTVSGCHVLQGLPFMDGAVVGNLERRRYQPATRGGEPLDVQYTFRITVKLPP